MNSVIIDCYTDEASGLGVPPYLGTYPRYIYGQLKNEGKKVKYLTIDDLRLWKYYKGVRKEPSVKEKTNILVNNLSRNDAEETFSEADELIIILGVQVPGKYLSALPGTLEEIKKLLKGVRTRKVLTGPALSGTQLEGGKFSEKDDLSFFDEVKEFKFHFASMEKDVLAGAEIIKEIFDRRIIEIETGRGCKAGRCSFCTEPLKHRFENRRKEDVVKEVEAYYNLGIRHFRLGKQSDFYAADDPTGILREIKEKCPQIEVLHIDNVNPNSVVGMNGEEITKAIVKYCTAGNIAALGVESFDPEVVKANRMNTSPETALKAIRIINKYGQERGENGMPRFLPGINLIFGLLGESKETHKRNMEALNRIMEEGLLLRRINIRQVVILPGTYISENGGAKFWHKNKKYYWKWRNEIRQKIDWPMLKKIVPSGTVLEEVYAEIYDGKTTFCRQMGTYPLIVGVKGRLELGKKYKIKVVGQMLRSITGEVVS